MFLGHYPEDALTFHEKYLPKFNDKDMDVICQPLDFYGANIYTAQTVCPGENSKVEILSTKDGDRFISMEWHVIPDSLCWASKFFHERYKVPVIITENGMANHDWIDESGRGQDPQRIILLKVIPTPYSMPAVKAWQLMVILSSRLWITTSGRWVLTADLAPYTSTMRP